LSTSRLEKSLRSKPKQRADERLFAEAFEHAPNAMALLNANGKFIQVNHTLCSLLGFTRAELLELTSIAVTHPEDAATETEQRRRLAAGEINRYQLVQRFIRSDGKSTWARVSVSAWRRDSGAAEYYIVEVEGATSNPAAAAGGTQDWLARVGDATRSAVHEIGNTLTPLMLNTQMIVEQSKRGDIADSAQEIFKAARRIAFTLRRLRGIDDTQPVAYLGEQRMLDLRLVAPPKNDEPI
jgi:PAS domain S-box-containing protein